MAYIEKRVKAGMTIEIMKYHTYRYKSKKANCRSENVNTTPEAVRRVNQKQAENKLRWKINTNFKPGDYYLTLTYKRENRKTPIETKKEFINFMRRLRRLYKKADTELKYISVTEYQNTAIHHHMIINGAVSAGAVSALWEMGHMQIQVLDKTGDYSKLAAYLIKETSKTFKTHKSASGVRYSCSRNLREPVIHEKVVRADSWREMPKPIEGYYISGEVESGYHEVSGYGYQHYIMIKLI